MAKKVGSTPFLFVAIVVGLQHHLLYVRWLKTVPTQPSDSVGGNCECRCTLRPKCRICLNFKAEIFGAMWQRSAGTAGNAGTSRMRTPCGPQPPQVRPGCLESRRSHVVQLQWACQEAILAWFLVSLLVSLSVVAQNLCHAWGL